MAEFSYLWDSNGVGDGVTPYTEAQTALLFKALCGGDGVINYLNALAPSVSGSNVLIATGFACVDGHPYLNDASLSKAVTVPIVNTTGFRVVLRASWGATQTVRAVVILSADGTAAIPAKTTTSGTTLDVTIATGTITTLGVITLTDARQFVVGTVIEKYKSATQVFTTSTTLADVTATVGLMAVPMEAGDVWDIEWDVPLAFGGTGGAKFQISGPSSPTDVQINGEYGAGSGSDTWETVRQCAAVTAFATNINSLASADVTTTTNKYVNDRQSFAHIRARIINGSTAGPATLQAAQNNANSTTTLQAGTVMRARKVA